MSEISYIDTPITTNPEILAEAAFAHLQATIPGWAPNAGNLEVIIIEAMSRMVADARDIASAVPRSIFRYYGNSIIGLPPISDVQASVNSTWTMVDNLGYTIPAGTQVGLRAAGDELVAFETVQDVVIPPGSTATAAGSVALLAVLPGDEGNGLTGTIELLDPLDYVASVVAVGYSNGGVDAESDDMYLNRLATELRLLTPRPILPDDFAVMAMGVPGVGRALAIDGYNPADSTENNQRMVTVVCIDDAGEPVSSLVATKVDTLLENAREVSFIVNLMNPTYTAIDVTCDYKIMPGAILADADAAVTAALTNYLSPANWGKPVSQDANPHAWVNQNTVRYLELATVVNNTAGVDYITTLQLAQSGNARGTSNVVLTGRVPLPRPGDLDITGSV